MGARIDGKDFSVLDLKLVLVLVLLYSWCDETDLSAVAVKDRWERFLLEEADGIAAVGSDLPTTHQIESPESATPEGVEINPEEAAYIQHEQWASHVECMIAKGCQSESVQMEANPENDFQQHLKSDLTVLTFSRNPAEFDAALLASDFGDDLRAHGVNIQPSWAKSAKIMAVGVTEDMVAELPRSLGLRDVI